MTGQKGKSGEDARLVVVVVVGGWGGSLVLERPTDYSGVTYQMTVKY